MEDRHLHAAEPSGAPPPYALHEDSRHAAPKYRRQETPPPSEEQRNATESNDEDAETPPPSPEPLSLTMDRDLIYPTHPPSTAMYHLPRTLTWSGDRVFLEKSVPAHRRENGKWRKAYDQDLYEIRGQIFSMSCEIIAKRANCYQGRVASMKKRRSLFGDMWDISFKERVVLRYNKCQWKDAAGAVVAIEEKNPMRRVVVIQEGIDSGMRDLIVAAWCAKVWREGTKPDLATTLSRGEGFIKTAYGGKPSFAARFAGA